MSSIFLVYCGLQGELKLSEESTMVEHATSGGCLFESFTIFAEPTASVISGEFLIKGGAVLETFTVEEYTVSFINLI